MWHWSVHNFSPMYNFKLVSVHSYLIYFSLFFVHNPVTGLVSIDYTQNTFFLLFITWSFYSLQQSKWICCSGRVVPIWPLLRDGGTVRGRGAGLGSVYPECVIVRRELTNTRANGRDRPLWRGDLLLNELCLPSFKAPLPLALSVVWSLLDTIWCFKGAVFWKRTGQPRRGGETDWVGEIHEGCSPERVLVSQGPGSCRKPPLSRQRPGSRNVHTGRGTSKKRVSTLYWFVIYI